MKLYTRFYLCVCFPVMSPNFCNCFCLFYPFFFFLLFLCMFMCSSLTMALQLLCLCVLSIIFLCRSVAIMYRCTVHTVYPSVIYLCPWVLSLCLLCTSLYICLIISVSLYLSHYICLIISVSVYMSHYICLCISVTLSVCLYLWMYLICSKKHLSKSVLWIRIQIQSIRIFLPDPDP